MEIKKYKIVSYKPLMLKILSCKKNTYQLYNLAFPILNGNKLKLAKKVML